MSRLLVICMLSIALASLVTSDTTANSTVVCQGSACQQEKAGSGTGTSETSKRTRRHSTAADTNSLKDHAKMAPNSESSVVGDSQSAKWNSETSVEQGGGGREKRWAYGRTRCARGSYFHPDLGKCIQKENYYADGTYGETSVQDARPWRAKPEIRHRRRWRSNSGGITGNRHWLQGEPKGIVESQGLQRPYRTPRYLGRQTVGVPLRQTGVRGSAADSQERSRGRWGEVRSSPIRSRLNREPRSSRHERGFWSKLFHIHSSSNNETTKHGDTVGPYIQAPLSKQSVLNIGEVDKPQTMQSSQDHESTRIDTLSDTDPLFSKLEKEISVNVTEPKDLSPRPMVMKVTYEPEWNNDHSKFSDNSGKKSSATNDLLNEERHKAAGEKYKTVISGTDIENTESKDSLTIKDLGEKSPELQNLVPPLISLNETLESNSVDYPASNNDDTDYSQRKLPGEEMAASKDFLKKQIQKPVGERYQTLAENTSTADLWATNSLAGKVVEYQNADPSQLAQNETFEVKRAKSPASASDHNDVTGYSSRIVAGAVNGVSKDFLYKRRPLPVGYRYNMFMGGPDTQNSIIKSSLDRKDVAGQVDSTLDHRSTNEAEKESEITVKKRKYEGLPALHSSALRVTSDTIPKPEQKRRRDVMSQNLGTMFSDQAQGVGQMPVFLSNTDFTGEASEVLPLREKIHRIYELARKPVYNSQWSSDGAQSSAPNDEAVIKSFNNEQKGFHWWHSAASDDSGIQNQQSLRPDESDSATHNSGDLYPFYMGMDSNKAVELEKKKSRGEDLHHENTIAGKLISGLIKRPGEPISASGLNGPTAEQAISRTHEGPMTPTYEDSYSEMIPVDYGPQDFDLGSSSIDESDSENNKDTLEYPLPNNAGGNQWRQQIFHGHDVPYVQDLGAINSQAIQDDPRWGPGVGVSRLTSRDQHFVSPQSVLLFQQPDYNQNSFRNSPEASIPGLVSHGRLFPLSPSISLDRADHRPFEEGANPFHFSPTGSRHPIFAATFPQSGGEHTDEQHLFQDSSRGLAHLQSMRSVSHAANSFQFPASRELGQGSYEEDRVNDFNKRNLPDGSTRRHSTADTDIARRLRVQRALRKFDTTGLLQSNVPLVLPQSLQMNQDAFSNNPTGDVFQQSLPEMNIYNADASQYGGHQPQNYLPQEQLLNMHAESGNQYSQISNTEDRSNLEFTPHNFPEYHESLPNSQFVPNSAQFETAMFQNPEIKFSNAPQTWFQPQNTYGSFEGYQAPPSVEAKTQGEKVSSQIVELNHESLNDGEFPEPEKVPPQNYIPIYNYTLAEQKNVQIPIPTSNDSTYASYDSDFPSRGMDGTQVSASLEPSIQYEYPKTMEAANIQAPLYPFSEKSDNQRVSEASAPNSFSMSNESLLEAVAEMPMNGNSEVHDVLVSTKAPENLPHMSFVGHLAEQPSGLPLNGLPSVSSEKQSQRQQLESLLSQHVHQTRVESNMQQPSFHSSNSFNPPIKKSSSEPGKLQQLGTMIANELKSLHIHRPTLPQKEESQLYSNTDSDAARAAYQKWLNERINMQARVLQALQPRSAPGQVSSQSDLNGPSQLRKDAVEVVSAAGINNLEGKMVPAQGNANFPAVLKISVDIPSYAKMRKWDSSIQERPGVVHPSQDDLSPGHKFIDSSNMAKILDKKEHDRAGVNELKNVGGIKTNVQSPEMRVQNSQKDSTQDLSLITPDRRQQDQYAAPIYDIRKSSFQTFVPQSVTTATWANKMAIIRSICNDHKDYEHASSNPLRLPRDKRQVVIYDDFLRDLLKMMNIGERYLFPSSVTTGAKQINTTFRETNDSNQLRQLPGIETKDTTSSKDGTESVKNEKEVRITVDKIKDLCEIIRDNPSLLDSVLSKISPEEAPQLKLESAIYQDPSIISSEQVENQSPNFPNEHILYTNSVGFHYSHEPHEGSHMEHMHETAGGPHTDHIHEEGDSHTNHIHYPHEGSHTGYSHDIGQDSHTDQWHDEDRGSNADHYHHYADEVSHADHYHNAGEASHPDHYHNADEATHPDHWPNVDNGHHLDHWPTADNGHHPDHWPTADNGHHPEHWPNTDHGPHTEHWPNEDHGPHTDHWPNEDLSPHLDHWHNPVVVNHPDHWPNVDESPHPDHWHNGEESSHTDHTYHAGEEHYPDHLYDTYDNSHHDHSYDTDENAQVFETDELGSEDLLEEPEELPTDTAEGHPLNHVSSMVETSIDTIRCDDHVVHKLTIQIPADMWKLLQEGSGAHSGEPIVTIQIEVPVFDHNDSNFEDFPEDALVNTKRNTPEKNKEFQFHITPTFDKADVMKLENERKASNSHYSSQEDVSSLHQRTVSEFLHSLPGMQRTPSFNGPESNATVLQFVPGVYPEGIGQTKRQENSYFIEKERTRLVPGAAHSSGNAAAFHNNIAGLSTESKTRLAKNDPRLLSFSIYHSRPGGLRILPEGGGTVPLRVVGPNGEVLYDTNKECQSVPARAFPVSLVPAQVTEVNNTVQDRSACNNSSCKQLIGSSMYSNGDPSSSPNVQLRSINDLVRFFQNPNQPSVGRDRNLRNGRGVRYKLETKLGNTRNIRSSVSKKEKKTEMTDKILSNRRHSLTKHALHGLPRRNPDKSMVVNYKTYGADVQISKRSSKTHRHTDEVRFGDEKMKDMSRRLPHDSAVATVKQTLKHNDAPVLRKDNSESNHFKVLASDRGSVGANYEAQKHKRRLLWLEEYDDDEETLLPRVYARNPQQLVTGTLSEQSGIVDEKLDVKTNPLHYSSQFPERYSNVRRPLDSYNAIKHSTKRSQSLLREGSSYVTGLGSSRRRQTKAGEIYEGSMDRLASPHQQKRKSGLSHYFLKSQLARNHLLPNVRNGKYEPASLQPNTGKHRQRRFLKNWHLRQSPQVRQSTYWSNINIPKFNYPNVQFFDDGHFEPKRGSEVPDKNISSVGDQSASVDNTTVNPLTEAQNSDVNNSSTVNSTVTIQKIETQQKVSAQSMNASVPDSPEHSEMSSTELNVTTGNHSSDQSPPTTTEICTTVEDHPHAGADTIEGSSKSSGGDKVDASLDLKLKLQYDKNKDALEGEIQDFHLTPKGNESHENNVMQNHSNELQHTALIRSYNTLSYFRRGTLFPAQSAKERLALFEYSVKHGSRPHTFHGTPNSYKRNFDFKEVPKNDLPPSNYKSVHNFPFRQKDEAPTDTMFHQVSSSNQYPYESSNSQNGIVQHYPHISYYSTNKNIDDVVNGHLSPADVLQSQSNPETLSHSVPEKWNYENSKSASSQMKQIENYAEDKVSDSEIISTNLTNKLNYETSDWMDRSPSYSSYVPEENNFESLVGKISGGLHDSYTITRSLARYTDDKDDSLQQGTSENRRQTDGESEASNQENIPARVSGQESQYPFTDTSNKNMQNVVTNFPLHPPFVRNKLNVGLSVKDVAGIGVDLESSDEDWKNRVDLDSIEVVRSFQHGRKILHENEDEADDVDDYDDGDVDPANDNLLFEYDKLKNFQTKRKVNINDSKFHIHPTSDDTFPKSKRSFNFRNHAKAQRTPKRQHPKFRGRSMAKSQHISSVKKTGTHEKIPVNSEPVYLTTYLETKQSAHPHDIQIKKRKEMKNDVPKSMHRRVLSSAEEFSIQDDNLYQPHKTRDDRFDKSSKKHTLPSSALKVRRGHTHKKQQLSYNHKTVNPSHSYNKNSKSLLHQREGAKIKVKKERGKEKKARKKNLHSKKHTNTFHRKHSKHKHSPPKRHYLVHANQSQYRSKNTNTELEAGNILHKQRHHTRKKRSTNERETSNHEQASLAKSYSGESKESEVNNFGSSSIPGKKHSLHGYESFRARAPHEMKSGNIVKSVDLENNFLGINLKSPVTNETHYLKKMNMETLGNSRPVKYPHSSKLNYMYNLQEDVSPEKKVELGNLKLTEEMKHYPRTRYCSDKFHHLLPCSHHEDSERFYQHVIKPKKFNQPVFSAEDLDKKGDSQQKSLTMTQNNKKLCSVGCLHSVRTVGQELPQKGISELTIEESPDTMHSLLPHQDIFRIGSHLNQDQPEPLSGHHIDVDSSIYRNTHNAQQFNGMNISENIIPAIKFTGLADSGTKNRISELQNMYRHKHLQYANQPKHLSYINMQESKPVLLSDSMHVFGKGIVGTSENVSNLADKRMKYGFDERTRFFPNEKLPQKLFRSRSKEKFQITDKINVKNRLIGDTRKSMKFYADKYPKIQSNKHMKDIKLKKSESIQQNEDENRVQGDSNVIPVKKDSSLFGKALTSKKGMANMNKLASNYSFNVYKQQISSRSSGKKMAENLQSAVKHPRVNKMDLSRNIKIRADQTDILTGNDDDATLEATERDIVVTTIPDIVSDDEEEDEYEMIVTTSPVIPKTDAKQQWNFEPEDVTEATDYIEEENTDTGVSTPVSLQPISFTETAPSENKVENWPEVEGVMETTDSVEEESNDIEISTSVSLQPESITEFVPRVIQVENGPEMEVTDEEITTFNQITTGAGTDSALGHIKEGLTTEVAALTKSQVETEIPNENLRTANTEMYNSRVVSNGENQAAVNVEVETTEMQIEYEEEHENENTTVLEMKGSPGKVTPTSTSFSTKNNTVKVSSEVTVTAKIMPEVNETTEKVTEEGTEIMTKNTSISDKEYEESTENVSAESMLTEIYNTEGNLTPESEKEGEEEGEVEVEGTEETTGYQETERYSESTAPAATVAVSSISTEHEINEKTETVTTENEAESDTEITQVLEEYPEEEPVEEGQEKEEEEEEATELQPSSEESTEGITATLAPISEEVGGGVEEEEQVEEEAGGEELGEEGVGRGEVGEEETTEGIIGTLAPAAEEEGEEEEVGEEETTEVIVGTLAPAAEEEEGEEVGEEETTEGIVGTLAPAAEEEEGEEEEVGEEETTEVIVGTLAPAAEEEEGEEEEVGEEEIGEEEEGEKFEEEGVGGAEVGEEETTEEIVGTLFPTAEEEGEVEGDVSEGEVGEEAVGGEVVGQEAVGGEELGEEETAEGITGTLTTTSENKGEEEEEIGSGGGGGGEEEVGEVVPIGGGEEEGETVGGGEVGEEEEEEALEIETTSVGTVEKMLTESEPSTNRAESETVEGGVTTEGEGRTEGKGMTEEGIAEEERTTEMAEAGEEEEIAEEEETTEVKTTSRMVATTEEGEMIGVEETTAVEETAEEQETTTVVKTTEEEGTTETSETEETLKEEEVYAEYLASEETTQGVEMTSHKIVQPGETTLAGKLEECRVNQSSCICSLDDMLHELSATSKGSSVLEAASRYDKTCPKSSGQIGKFRITNDMEPVVPHQKERDKNTVRLMKNITAIGIMPALAVSNTAVSVQETLIFPGSHVIIPCANITEMFQVDDRGVSYHWLSPSGKELTGGHTELIEDGKYLRLSGVVPRDDGTYRCETPTSDNRTASPSYIHRIRVVQLPQVVQQVTVRYKITPHCGEDMAQLLQLFLAPVVRKTVCGQLCSITIPKASCSIGEDGRPQMMVIFLSRLGHAHHLLPGHEQSDCDVLCSARVDAIFANIAALNLPRVLTSKGFRTAPPTSRLFLATWLCHF